MICRYMQSAAEAFQTFEAPAVVVELGLFTQVLRAEANMREFGDMNLANDIAYADGNPMSVAHRA
jgi:hypothetical protein